MFRLLPLFLFLAITASAQKQLVLLKRGNPIRHFTEGAYIHVIMKDGTRKEGVIIELSEFSMITTGDTIQFNKIHKVGIPKGQRRGIAPMLGGLLLAAGVVYFSIDMINSALGYNTAGIDPTVATRSAILVTVGGALFFIRPKYDRVNNGTFLRTVDYKSKFYKSPYD
jgi:hypothetical protein